MSKYFATLHSTFLGRHVKYFQKEATYFYSNLYFQKAATYFYSNLYFQKAATYFYSNLYFVDT